MRFKVLLLRYWWFIALLAVAGSLLVNNIITRNRTDREMGFAFSQVQSITSIVIEHGNTHLLLQKGSSDSWLLNGDTPASTDAVNTLFRVISRLQLAGPVPISSKDSLLSIVRTDGLSVQFFSGRKLVRAYRLAYTTFLNQQTIGLMARSNKVYRIELPGYEGSIVDLFKTAAEYWIGKHITMPALSSIHAVEVEVPHDPEQSFRIDITDSGEFRVFHIYSGMEIDGVNSTRVQQFLTNLTQAPYVGIASLSKEEMAAIVYSEPDFIYNVFTKDGKNYFLKVFPIPVDEYTDEFGRPVNVDLDRVYLTVSASNQLFIANYINLHQLLRNISSFTN